MAKILVFTMQKVGSSSMINALKTAGNEVDRGYEENIDSLPDTKEYDAIYTMVRDPVARNISWMFETDGAWLLASQVPLQETKEAFLKDVDHQYPLNWFDDVFFPRFNINVYKYPFVSPLILGKICILKTDTMIVHNANTVDTRPYGELYRTFLDQVKFPEHYLDMMYKSKFTQHFFLPEEIDEMYERWIE